MTLEEAIRDTIVYEVSGTSINNECATKEEQLEDAMNIALEIMKLINQDNTRTVLIEKVK